MIHFAAIIIFASAARYYWLQTLWIVISFSGLFEIPMLRMGYPNQFFIETIMLGFCIGSIRASDRAQLRTNASKFALDAHPFFIPMIFVSVYGLVSFSVMSGTTAAASPSGHDFKSEFIRLLSEINLWDVRSWVHGPSIAYGYAIQCWFVREIAIRFAQPQQVPASHFLVDQVFGHVSRCPLKFVFSALIVGSLVIFSYAICQYLEVESVPVVFSVGIGGTYQNGNLLSLASGIILLLVQYLWIEFRTSRQRILLAAVFGFACFCLVLGSGRTSMMGLILAIFLFHAVYGIKCGFVKFTNAFWILLALFMSSISFFFTTQWFKDRLNTFTAESPDLQNFVKPFVDFSWTEPWRILFASGREPLFMRGVELLQEKWLFGIGLGNFFTTGGFSLPLHNTYLEFAVESGIFALLAIMWSGFRYLNLLYSTREFVQPHHQALSIAIFVFFFCVSMADSMLSYRSILVMASCVFTADVCVRVRNNRVRWSAHSSHIDVFFYAAVLLGLLTILSPQSRMSGL